VVSVIAEDVIVDADALTEAKEYELQKGDTFTVKYKAKDGESVPFEFPNLEETSDGKLGFKLDEDGKVIEAHFKSTENKKYPLGNQLVELPKGAEVDFSDGKANIKMPADSKVVAAKILNKDSEGDTDFSYQSANGKFLFENGNFLQMVDKNGKLKFDGNFYYDKGLIRMNKMEIRNDQDIRTYIDFKGEINPNYEGAYISMNDGTFVTGSNLDVFGPKINFLEGNPYGLRVKSGDVVAVQALGNPQGNYVKIVNRNAQGKIPKIDYLNEFGMNVDGKTVHYNSIDNKLYLSSKTLLAGFTPGKSSVPVELEGLRTNNGKIEKISKFGNVLGVTDDVEFAYGNNPAFIQTTTGYNRKYTSLKKGFSNSWLYYNIKNVRDVNRFLGGKLVVSDSTGLLNDPKNSKMVADLLAGLPPKVYRGLRTLRFKDTVIHEYTDENGRTHRDSVGGLAGHLSRGDVQVSKSNFGAETIRHEITHTFQFSNPKGFWSDWENVGYNPRNQLDTWSGANQGFAWGYGSSSLYEDGATYGDKLYQPSYWKNLVGKSNRYNKIYRGKLAVLRKHNGITQLEYSAIMRTNNLDSSSSSVQKYINEARAFVR